MLLAASRTNEIIQIIYERMIYMHSILEAIYYGDMAAWERKRPNDPEYDVSNRKISTIKKHFEEILSPEEYGRFEELENLYTNTGTIEEICLFKYAFSMGVLLTMDVYDFIGEL